MSAEIYDMLFHKFLMHFRIAEGEQFFLNLLLPWRSSFGLIYSRYSSMPASLNHYEL